MAMLSVGRPQQYLLPFYSKIKIKNKFVYPTVRKHVLNRMEI